MTKTPSPDAPQPMQDIKTLRSRFDDLNRQKIRVEADRASSERRLDELRRKARDRYGTDDLDALRARLDEMTADNERRRRQYQEHLDQIEARLAAVEAEHARETDA